MSKWALSFLLLCAPSALLGAPPRAATILDDLEAHGYVSPGAAIARLQAAADANDGRAPVDQRRRYYAKLITLAAADRNVALLQDALGRLQQMAQREHCDACETSWLIGKSEDDLLASRLKDARTRLQHAAGRIAADDEAMQLKLALVETRLARQQGAMNVAFGHAMKGLPLAEKTGDVAARIKLQLDLTVIDTDLGYLQRAAAMAQETIAAAQAAGFTAALAQAYINDAYVNSQQGDRPQQLLALQQALKIAANVPGLRHVEAAVRINLSDYYLHQKEFDAAMKYGREGAALAQSDNDLYLTAVALANAGLALAGSGDQHAALDTLQQSMDYARRSGNLRAQSIVSRELVKLLQADGRYKDALETLESVEQVNQQITEQKRDNAVLELQAKYDDERKNREIERLSAQARLKDAEAAARRSRQTLWTVLAAGALAAAVLLVFRLMRARRANQQLTRDVAELTEQSSLDELTGVFNRRHFAAMMQPYEHDPEARVGLMMVDVDRFKRINDQLGHDTGDLVLKEIARRLQALVREHDRVVRWGGEEFVLVLPDAAPHGLPQMARRLLETVAATPFDAGGQPLHVSVSAGCVVHPLEPGSSWDAALRLADNLMYRAKRHGRNRAACLTALDAPFGAAAGDEEIVAGERSGAIEIVEVTGPAIAEAFAAG